MKLLLDTHIWIWLLQDPVRLHHRALQAVRDKSNELWLSPISTWEALTLHKKGRLRLQGDLGEWLARATAGIKEAVLTHEIMIFARELPLHKDPADRMIAATAAVIGLTLLTADERLLGLPHIKTLANR